MKLKKIAALVITAALAFSAIACGAGTTTTTAAAGETTKAAEETTTAAAAETTTAEGGDKVTGTLTVWSPAEDQSEEQGNWLKAQTEAFKAAHPEFDVSFEFGVMPEGDAKATVTQDPAAAADVYMYANDNLTALIAANGIAKLGGETADYVKNTNSEAIVNSVSVDGAIYGVPFTTNTWFMYYDKSKFSEEEAGSFDAMLAKDVVSFPMTNSWYLASFYVANGATLFGPDGTDEAAGINFGGDNAAAVTKYLVDVVNNPNFRNDADGAGMAGLRDGSIAAMFSGSWDCSAAKEALGDNFAAKSLPTITIDGEEKQMKSFAGSKAIAVNPNSKIPQVAVAFARFLGSPEAQLSHYELRGIVPCNTELLADDTLKADMLVVAQNETFDKTSIIQPFVKAMDNYWAPAENFGKSLVNDEITADNAAEKTEELNNALNGNAQ